MSKTIGVKKETINDITDLAIKMDSILEVVKCYAENNMDTNQKIANIFSVLDELCKLSEILVDDVMSLSIY